MKRLVYASNVILIVFLYAAFSFSQSPNLKNLIEEIFSVASPSGYEKNMYDVIIQNLPEFSIKTTDNLGSLYLSLGNGEVMNISPGIFSQTTSGSMYLLQCNSRFLELGIPKDHVTRSYSFSLWK